MSDLAIMIHPVVSLIHVYVPGAMNDVHILNQFEFMPQKYTIGHHQGIALPFRFRLSFKHQGLQERTIKPVCIEGLTVSVLAWCFTRCSRLGLWRQALHFWQLTAAVQEAFETSQIVAAAIYSLFGRLHLCWVLHFAMLVRSANVE